MTGECKSKIKKVPYYKMSDKKCPHCGDFLKENAVLKDYTMCYICKKVTSGKTITYKYYYDGTGRHVVIDPKTKKPKIAKDFVALQKSNRIKNNWKR